MSNDIRKFMNLMEAPEWERDEAGRVKHPDISYDIGADKAIANLKSYNSQSYTKLAQKLERIKQLSEEVDQLKEEVKAETKDSIGDLFAAEDAARTRIVETVSFIFQMSKNPKETNTPKYKDILEELSKSLTPELITVMENLKKTMVTTVQKSPSLKVTAKEGVMEGVMDAISGFLAGFLAKVQAWGTRYDSKLAALKAKAGVMESEGFEDNATELDEYDSKFAAEGIDYNRVDRIEKQVDFMAGRGRSRDEIVANITSKMGDVEGEHAATYFDTVHGVNEDAVRAGKYDPSTGKETRPGKDDPEGRKALAKDVKDQRTRSQQAAADGNASHVFKKGAASGQANHEINRKYQKGHSYDSPWTTTNRVKEAMAEVGISEDDLDSSEARLMREYEEMMETMAFSIGQTVYSGSRSGKVLGSVDGVDDAILVQLPNGEQAAFKKKDCSTKKPGMMKKAAHWMVGEDKGEMSLAGDDAHAANKPDQDGKLWVHSYKQWIDHSKYFAGAKPSLSGHEITAYDRAGSRKMAGMWDLQGRKGWIDTTLYSKHSMKEDEMEPEGDEAGLTEWDDRDEYASAAAEYRAMHGDEMRDHMNDERSTREEQEAIQSVDWKSGNYDVEVPFTSDEAFIKFMLIDYAAEGVKSMQDLAEFFDDEWEAIYAAKTLLVRGNELYAYKGTKDSSDTALFNEVRNLSPELQKKLAPFVATSREEAVEDYFNGY